MPNGRNKGVIMFYDYAFSIAANTTSAAGLTLDMPVDYGVLTRLDVHFPPGCCGLVYVVVERFVHQLFPSNVTGKFRSDNETVIVNCEYDIIDKPFSLTVRGWNYDTRYSHTIDVRLTLKKRESGLIVIANATDDLLKELQGGK